MNLFSFPELNFTTFPPCWLSPHVCGCCSAGTAQVHKNASPQHRAEKKRSNPDISSGPSGRRAVFFCLNMHVNSQREQRPLPHDLCHTCARHGSQRSQRRFLEPALNWLSLGARICQKSMMFDWNTVWETFKSICLHTHGSLPVPRGFYRNSGSRCFKRMVPGGSREEEAERGR